VRKTSAAPSNGSRTISNFQNKPRTAFHPSEGVSFALAHTVRQQSSDAFAERTVLDGSGANTHVSPVLPIHFGGQVALPSSTWCRVGGSCVGNSCCPSPAV
jgi:hypothetical protein